MAKNHTFYIKDAMPGRQDAVFWGRGQLMEDADALLGRIRNCIVGKRYKDAVRLAEDYLRPVTREVLPAQLHLAVAQACENIGDFARAQSFYRIYARFWPKDNGTPAALYASARIAYEHLNDYDGALRHLMVIMDKFPRWAGMENVTKLLTSIQGILARVSAVKIDPADTSPRLVIRQTSDKLPVAQIAKVVAYFSNSLALDVTRRLRNTGWILAWDLDHKAAMALAEQLQNLGVPVLVLPTSQMVTLPPVEKAKLCAPMNNGLQISTRLGTKPETVLLPWDDIKMVIAGFVKKSTYQPAGTNPFGGFGGIGVGGLGGGFSGGRLRNVDMSPAVRPAKIEQVQIIDLVSASGDVRYRMYDGDTVIKYREKTRHDFSALARMFLIGSKGRARANEAAYLIAGRQKIRGWQEFVFTDFDQFDTYVFWQLNLHKFS